MHTLVLFQPWLWLYLLLCNIVILFEPILAMSTEPDTGLTGLYARMQARLGSLSEERNFLWYIHKNLLIAVYTLCNFLQFKIQ